MSGRNTPMRSGEFVSVPVEANTELHPGQIGAVNVNGNAIPGTTVADIKAVGRVEEYVKNNPGLAGDQRVKIRRGVFLFDNDDTDPVLQQNLLSNCYIVDDHTVAANDGAGTRSVAGKIIEVENGKVWVEIR